MAEFTKYAPGTPSWVDIGIPDPAGAKEFYGKLLGWQGEDLGPDAGGYGMFTLRGKQVAGYGPQQNPGPPFWTSYISVADADAAAKKIQDAGGSVVMPPMDVFDAGRMGVFTDPTGAFISVWQPKQHIGAQIANEPGSFCWTELNTRDIGKAGEFYTKAFGWKAVLSDVPGMAYTEFQLNGSSIAGMMEMPPNVPAEVPAYWLVYFAVDDCENAIATATSNGGSVLVPPMDVPTGRFAVISDPFGANLGVIKLNA